MESKLLNDELAVLPIVCCCIDWRRSLSLVVLATGATMTSLNHVGVVEIQVTDLGYLCADKFLSDVPGLHLRVVPGKDLKRAQWNGSRVPQKNFRDTIRVPQLWGRRLGDTILGDTIVSLVVSLNVSPTVSLEGHGRVPHRVPYVSPKTCPWGGTILGDTIVSLVVSLNVSPTVSLEGHNRVR